MNPRLGVNIDHFATLRQLRGTPYPSLIDTAKRVEAAGAEQITVHLREDRRHIQDEDVKILKKKLNIPLNLEMALSEPIIRFALKIKPDWCCIVPEKRNEVTTEGGLNLIKNKKKLQQVIKRLKKAKIKVSLFIEPSLNAVKESYELGADAVELHTGRFALLTQMKKVSQKQIDSQKEKIFNSAILGRRIGLSVHAGHGLDDKNVRELITLRAEDESMLIKEYNIGHYIVCRAAIVGVERAVREMVSYIKAY